MRPAPPRTATTTPLSFVSWAAFSLVVASAAVWFKHEDFVVWLLAEGLIEEQATRALPGTVRSAALVVGVIGLVAAWRLAVSRT